MAVGLTSHLPARRVVAGWFAVPVVLLALWQAASSVQAGFVVASPTSTLGSVADGLREGWLWAELRITLGETALGYLVAVLVGLWLGFAIGSRRYLTQVFEPLILGLYSIPKVTLFPIFLFMFGLGTDSKVAFGMFHGVFPVVIYTILAVRGVPRILVRLSRSLRLNPLRAFWYVVLPWALPTLITGLRFGFSLTLLGVVIGEMFASRHGSGYILLQAATSQDTPRAFAILAALILVAFVGNTLFLALGWLAARHQQLPESQRF